MGYYLQVVFIGITLAIGSFVLGMKIGKLLIYLYKKRRDR